MKEKKGWSISFFAKTLTPVFILIAVNLSSISCQRKGPASAADDFFRPAPGMKVIYTAGNGKNEARKMLAKSGVEFSADAFVQKVEEGDIDSAKLFIKGGLDVNAFNCYGVVALMPACGNGCVEMVKLLMEAGAKVNVADPDLWTPLMWAERAGHAEVARMLREAGALEGRLR